MRNEELGGIRGGKRKELWRVIVEVNNIDRLLQNTTPKVRLGGGDKVSSRNE